ncbi:hypothetical protein ACFPVY_06340 [Flavobacterium qiangtangense]|uniref:Uncharacterized protein n=1 Tax=Flavobacterium qiangtangense TaxID=1442595 RepID=A0ABW1PKX3_9FLAO
MKNLVSKLFFGAAVVMMSSMISCKDKDANNPDGDMDTTTVVVDPVTPAPTTGMPADTAGMSNDTTTVTP